LSADAADTAAAINAANATNSADTANAAGAANAADSTEPAGFAATNRETADFAAPRPGGIETSSTEAADEAGFSGRCRGGNTDTPKRRSGGDGNDDFV
jgi:hypothetical protein